MNGPMIIQSDKTILLEVSHPNSASARAAIAPFAELERAPEHIHTYRITPLALWNARAAGLDAEYVIDVLITFAKYDPPRALLVDIVDIMVRYGRLRLEKHREHGLILTSTDSAVFTEVIRNKKITPMLGKHINSTTVCVHPSERGRIKQALIKLGWPAEDCAGYVDGKAHAIALNDNHWQLRDYQKNAVNSFIEGGSGVIVMPCGSGKTIVGIAAMAHIKVSTLILVTNSISAAQWRNEILRTTTLSENEVGEYSGEKKEIRPVTVATYSIVTKKVQGAYRHLELFDARDWGLIVYDEVHLLPAPVFRLTADLQSRRRLGLTATLIREDGRENDVFSLIGPKRCDIPWKEMEAQGWIAAAQCTEIRVTLAESTRLAYAISDPEKRYQICASAQEKIPIISHLLQRHAQESILIIGAFIEQLHFLSEKFMLPVIDGSTSQAERSRLFNQFRNQEITTLLVSKVANFSIDLPETSVAIQISGTFGSRQEEAQRLGRTLRPKRDQRQAYFYTIVARDTLDADYAQHRQRFLAEQGYAYTILDAEEVLNQ